MVKKKHGVSSLKEAREIAARTAESQGFELVDVTLQKEADGMALCIYADKEGGMTLDDCERFHKAVQPHLEAVEYDYLEVSSPGADRPVKTLRDFEKHRGEMVEVKLFAKLDGMKQYTGTLDAMDEETVTITAGGNEMVFQRKAVALVRPVVEFSENEE